ncbi:MAG TPA: biotin/lipoyl-containing protein [Vicinamibacteria bacterium]|nr:biotin/lipoyl-containing protein [Vicinamibacteria bacterium]
MRLVCGDQAIEIDVQDAGGEARVTVAGQTFEMRVETVGPGTFVCSQGDRHQSFHCVRDGDTVHLFWGGRVYRLEEETERSRGSHRHVGGGLEAPMPGKVIAVKVAPGDTVGKGDELVVVEAMKMENAVRAPRAGRVKSVSARVGDMVSPGVVLVELE